MYNVKQTKQCSYALPKLFLQQQTDPAVHKMEHNAHKSATRLLEREKTKQSLNKSEDELTSSEQGFGNTSTDEPKTSRQCHDADVSESKETFDKHIEVKGDSSIPRK